MILHNEIFTLTNIYNITQFNFWFYLLVLCLTIYSITITLQFLDTILLERNEWQPKRQNPLYCYLLVQRGENQAL